VSERPQKRTSALYQLTLARWRGFYREPSALFWTFAFPVLLAIALGVAFRNQPPAPVAAAVEVSAADTAQAEAIRAALVESKQVNASISDADTCARWLRNGKVAVVIVPGLNGRSYRFDPTRPESRLARLVVDDVLQRADGRHDPTTISEARVTEPGSRYIDFLIPGLLGMGLMSSGLWGIGFVLVEMRTRKLIKRMVATPMRKRDFLFAFVLMRGLFLLGEIPIMVGFAHFAFDVPVRGSLALLGAVSVLGALSFSALGLLLAARANNTQTVAGLVNLVTIPMSLGSGVFFPSERFPELVQPLIHALPLTGLIDSIRAVMIDGAGPLDVWKPCLVMVAWGVVSLALALRWFRWR
jgi:ABC-type multidrug transport system permease subunit